MRRNCGAVHLGTAGRRRRAEVHHARQTQGMFFFFSNRAGCLPSLLISLAATALLYLIFVR